MFDPLKNFYKQNESEIILMIGVMLISLISFSAGRLTAPGLKKQPIIIENVSSNVSSAAANSAFQNSTSGNSLQTLEGRTAGQFVASKNSTKYHLPDCTGAKRIAEHNKIWFNSREEAESLGYTPAANCPGLGN